MAPRLHLSRGLRYLTQMASSLLVNQLFTACLILNQDWNHRKQMDNWIPYSMLVGLNDKQLPCYGVFFNAPIGSGTIKRCGRVGVGMAFLEEVCHWRGEGR